MKFDKVELMILFGILAIGGTTTWAVLSATHSYNIAQQAETKVDRNEFGHRLRLEPLPEPE